MTLTRTKRLMPRCICGHAYAKHAPVSGACTHVRGTTTLAAGRLRSSECPCPLYVPKAMRPKRDPSGLMRITRAHGKPARLKSRLSDRADALAREICYRSGGVQFIAGRRVPGTGTCACCSEGETVADPIEWAHSFPRANRMCRWEPWGAFPVKRTHHSRFTRDPEGWRAFLVGKWGEERYQERYRLSRQTFGGSITVAFYRDLIARLRADLLRMRETRAA